MLLDPDFIGKLILGAALIASAVLARITGVA